MSNRRKSRKAARPTLAAGAKEFLDSRLREILDQMPVLVWTADRALRCTAALGGAGLPAGINARRLVGKTIRQLLYPNFEPAWSAHRKALEGTPQTYRREFRDRVYEASVEPLVGTGGKIIGIVGAAMDVTERHHAETQASKHQKMFAAIAKKGWEGLVLNSREGRIMYCNPSASRLLGRPARFLIGKGARDLIATEDLHRAFKFTAKVRRHPGRTFITEFSARRPDGSLRHFEYTATNLLDDPEVGAVVAKFRDISERKQSQEAIQSFSERLLKLQEEEERRIGRELHDSTSQWLTALMLTLGAIQVDDKLPRRSRAKISEALDLTRRAASEIRTASYLLHPPTLSEFGLMSALRDYVRGFAQRSGISVRFRGPHNDVERLNPYAEMAIFRIVQEALTNVHRHSQSKSAAVVVHNRGDRLTVEINDCGKGMPKEILASLQNGNIRHSGVGVSGIRERTLQLKGTLNIVQRSPGTGIKIDIPLKVNSTEFARPRAKGRAVSQAS